MRRLARVRAGEGGKKDGMRVTVRISPLTLHARTPAEERRRADRYAASGPATLRYEAWNGDQLSVPVEVRNWSARGAQIEADRAVSVDTRLQLRGENLLCTGVSRYCRQLDERYQIGIEFSERPEQWVRFAAGREESSSTP
jgi:hypothetical protein